MAEDTQPKIPNKYQSSYILWLSRNRKEYLENNKQMQLIDATRALAKEWSGLDDEEKEVWKRKAAKDYIRYVKELAMLKKTNPEIFEVSPQESEPKKKRKREKQTNGYLLFGQEERESLLNLPLPEQSRQLSLLWKSLTPEQRDEWNKKAAMLKEKNAQGESSTSSPPLPEKPKLKRQKIKEEVKLPVVAKQTESKPVESKPKTSKPKKNKA